MVPILGLLTLFLFKASAEVLTPPYFNIAENKRVEASYTCGEDVDEQELYCKLVGAIQDNNDKDISVIGGQVCDYCDSKNPEKWHPPRYAVDGTENYWLSPPLSRGTDYAQVNFTIYLGQEFHVAYVLIKMGISPRPGLWVLERSADNGKTYKPWQYFAERNSDCEHHFGAESLNPIAEDDSVICTTQFSKLVPMEHGEIVVSLLHDRPSANDFFNSSVLQEWTRATNVRLRLLKTQTLYGHLMSVERQDPTVTRRYFYSIKDISIGGRCRCNGHAEVCTETKEDKYKLQCVCQHDTCGLNCDTCCPNKVQKAWRQSKANNKFVCEGCNCHGHSEICHYNETVDRLHLSLDLHGNYEGGGVCDFCNDNTEGINCEKCKPGFYLPTGVDITTPHACVPCNCTGKKHTGKCQFGSGICECKPNYVSPYCDACAFGFTDYDECKPCQCNMNGTINQICDPQNNVCPCKPNFHGPQCNMCSQGFYDFPNCKHCNCNPIGALDYNNCNTETGVCECKNNYAPPKCEKCANGYYSFPQCTLCNCNKQGTVDEVCDKESGKCICKEGYAGENCGQCDSGYKGFPNCEPCGCTDVGSKSKICDSTGKCPCLDKFSGQTCNQCSPGYYNYPHCTPCGCSPYGTQGKSCDNEGNCKCLDTFQGKHCDKCKEGLYNYPICEACNCNRAGVNPNFTGCGQIEGELCECKANVQGRTCNDCKPLYWNLQYYNPGGCTDCDCHTPGVIGGIAECNSKSGGQCYCKNSVVNRKCSECADGSYSLQENNLFGCTDCGCDIGGSVPIACNKMTGQCVCKSRVAGRTCNKPFAYHYFPTLYQFKYEVEDWQSEYDENLKYGYNETEFPGFSWRGYAIFSTYERQIKQRVYIEYMSLYQIIVRYINRNTKPVHGVIKLKESATEDVQILKVVFDPSPEPSFITVRGQAGNLFISESRGMWEITFETPRDAPTLFVDYIVLMPDAYYEGNSLVENIKNPCLSGQTSSCLFYEYPNMDKFGKVKISTLSSELLAFEGWHLPIPVMSNEHPETGVQMNLEGDPKEPRAIVVHYATPKDVKESAVINVKVYDGDKQSNGILHLAPCHYHWLCRQVVLDDKGRVANFTGKPDTPLQIIFTNSIGTKVALNDVVEIPYKLWSFEYLMPSVVCTMKDLNCLNVQYPLSNGMRKLEFETENTISTTDLPKTLDSSVVLVRTDQGSPITLNSKVVTPGNYIFIVHYYQPLSPAITSNVEVQADKIHTGSLNFEHCPSRIGCRSVINGYKSNKFQISKDFKITINGTNNPIWLDYIVVVPEHNFKEFLLKEESLSNAERFKTECGANHFYIDEKNTTEFCKQAIFSLTTDFNNGALKCECNHAGSKDFSCEPFGGQCNCREFVIGRKCEECKANYYGFPNCRLCDCPEWAKCDKETGQCSCPNNVEGVNCEKCTPNTYNFHSRFGCSECKCHPRGVKNGNLQCDPYEGNCDCREHISGKKCDSCKPGYHSFPHCLECDCEIRGTTEDICDAYGQGECKCKRNVEGLVCDLCTVGTFNLDAENQDGCTQCFCFNRTTECSSSRLYWDFIDNLDDWGLVSIIVKKGMGVTELQTPLEILNPAIAVDLTAEETTGKEVYFAASEKYLGNKLGSYGGRMNYSIFSTSGVSDKYLYTADVIFNGGGIYLLYHNEELLSAPAMWHNISLLITESNFKLANSLPVSREQIMQVLGDLQAIYIKATYWEKSVTTRLQGLTMDIATEKYTDKGAALSVEQCTCPPQYTGLSCEECADGYYRSSTGSYGGFCVPCQCNGHAKTCDKVTGVCKDCEHNTVGDHCELCSDGFYGDAVYGTPWDCHICACPLPYPSNNFAKSCEVSEDGSEISCNCNEGYYGHRCQSCANGYYGSPEVLDDHCKPCDCSGNINITDFGACDSVSGECIKCLSNTAGPACNYCKPGYYGDAVVLKNCQTCSCHKSGTFRCDHATGACECHPNVEGEKCDRCAENHYLFDSGQGCVPCNCAEASYSKQCDDTNGQCRCKPGVAGRSCEKCDQGYWNYTSEGCERCSCNLQNSIKVGCNENGQCECLKDVIGEKCDGCPDRWVFIEKEGCFECGKCVHDLLDSVDIIKNRLEPISNEFESVAKSYFIQRRLQYLNETAIDLRPAVNILGFSKINIVPVQQNFEEVQQEVDRIWRKNSYTLSKANGSADDSLNKQSSELDKNTIIEINLVKEAISGANLAVDNVKQVRKSFDPSEQMEITQTEALEEAQKILQSLKDMFDPDKRKFLSKEDVQISYLERADTALENVRKFKEPVDQREKALESLKKRIEDIRKRLKDANTLALESLKASKKLSEATSENMKMNLSFRYDDIIKKEEESKELMKETNKLLENISSLLAASSSDLYIMFKDNKEIWVPLNSAVNQLIDETLTEEAVKNSQSLVHKAENWAENLELDANELKRIGEQQVSETNELLTYNQIISALRSAMLTAEKAKNSSENATKITSGIGGNVTKALEESFDILRNESLLLEKIDKLSDNLSKTKMEVEKLENEKDNIIKDLDAIDRKLESTVIKRHDENFLNDMDDANQASTELINETKEIASQLPQLLSAVKNVSTGKRDAESAVTETGRALDEIKKILPDINTLTGKLKNKPTEVENDIATLKRKMKDLHEKIQLAREAANKVPLAGLFDSKTTLEIWKPNDLPEQAINNYVSLYFKTREPNSLIFFIGNPASNERRHKRSLSNGEFMALEIQNGRPKFTVDLGSGHSSVICDVDVTDGHWHQAIAERTGKVIRLTIIPRNRQKSESEEVVEGSSFVLNLDKVKSKIFVGGIPSNFSTPPFINYNYFDGSIEGLVIGNSPLSLWNFKNEENLKPSYKRTELSNVSTIGCRFNGFGYVALNSSLYQMEAKSEITLSFQTKSKEGLLFLASNEDNFISIELREGRVLYQYKLGGELFTITSSEPYNNNIWHTLNANRLYGKGSLFIDSTLVQQGGSDSYEDKYKFEKPAIFYVGGYPGNHNLEYVTNIDFDGCINDVQLESIVNLNKNIESTGTSPGCLPKFDRVVSFEPGASGYLLGPNVTAVDNIMELLLSFKTSSHNGLLAYATFGSAYITLSLKNGQLLFKNGNDEVYSDSPKPYSDGKWHAVTAHIEEDKMELHVDDKQIYNSKDPPKLTRMLHGQVYFGGVPSKLDAEAAFTDQFVGCISDATLNNVIINFASTTDYFQAIIGKCDLQLKPTPVPSPPYPKPRPPEPPITGEPDRTPQPPRTTESKTTTTPAPIIREDSETCKLPLYPQKKSLNENDGYRLGTKFESRIEYMSLPGKLKVKYEFSIDVKTKAEQGIIFFASNKRVTDYISLFLQDGKVVYIFNCGSGEAQLNSVDKINNNAWHTITFKRNGETGTLIIDKFVVSEGKSEGSTRTLNVTAPYFIGGLDANTADLVSQSVLKGVNESLNGCVRNFKVNGNMVSKSRNDIGVIPCSEQDYEEGVYFAPEGGYVKQMERFTVGKRFTAALSIKPRVLSGLLLAIHGKKDYFVLEMVDGAIVCKVYSAGTSIINTYIPVKGSNYLCDGNWHRIEVSKQLNLLVLSIDNDYNDIVQGDKKAKNVVTKNTLYLGGSPERSLPGVSSKQYVGCIKELKLSNDQQDVDAFIHLKNGFGNITINACPVN